MDKSRMAFLVGMPRAATTFLYHNFSRHPDIFIPFRRKTNYFSLHYENGEDYFWNHFSDVPNESIAIDTETLAFVNRDLPSPQRIHAFNKDAKVILCVRDPGDWALSLYRQISTFDGAIPTFEQFLYGKYTLVEDNQELLFNMGPGDIARRIEEYKTLFPDTLLILKFSDVVKYPLEALRKIESHIGVKPFYNDGNIVNDKINSSDRSHSKLINKILRNEFVINIIKLLVPRAGVVYIRLAFDRISARFSGGRKEGDAGLGVLRDLASEYYSDDSRILKEYL